MYVIKSHEFSRNMRPQLGFSGGTVLKNPPAHTGDTETQFRHSLDPPVTSPGGRNGNPLQYSYLENSTDRGAWQATGYGVAKSWTDVLTEHTQGPDFSQAFNIKGEMT